MKFTKMFDLSQPLYHNCPGWPTYALTEVNYEALYPTHNFTAERINLNSHTGTHLDVPFHFYPDGKTIDKFPVDTFQGHAILVNLEGIAPDTGINVEHLLPYADKIHEGDIVCFYTGWCKKRGISKEYYYQWPWLTGEGAKWLSDKGIKAVGIDGLSIGGWGENGPAPHVELLSKEIWILEEMNFPEEILKYDEFQLFAFPILFKGFGGSLVRAVAMVEE